VQSKGKGGCATMEGGEAPRCDPPDSLTKYDPALFVGFDPPPTGASGPRKSADPASTQLDDMVNSMLPPREWTQESGTWMQYVSKEPATRLDVITLQELLDKRLLERQARETGICPVREDLYQQCFDELIRQVTLDGPERGLLLLRVRDEIRMTIDAYKILVREIFSAYLPACVRVCNRLSYLMPTP
jgi:dynein light intermediate chain